ncbi:TMEM175 family protein [Roseofilum casamattae]|uniref:TMEM175 family protein n=1 Tax=Roseofilum casamattae BLCC-M143 TaxID=3022442 RepID=A0ABT7BX10_9CYAN|nr:TMEM175 family protein [Roseofilum casamattae]MDJ1183737.1 TMEM175 family protein [Roseofilum casamattae BLCC-M143]
MLNKPIQRLTQLSDIIFAVTMTILALGFDPMPDNPELSENVTDWLLSQLPDLAMYVITFVTIAFYWLTHIHQFKYYQKTDSIHIFLTLFSLMFVVLLAYASDLSVFYDREFAVQTFFSLSATGIGLFSSAAWIYGTYNRRLVTSDLPDATIRDIRQEGYIEPIISLLAIGGAWLASWGWTATFVVGFPVAFLIQSKLTNSKDDVVPIGDRNLHAS